MDTKAWLTIARFEWKQASRQFWMILFTFLLLLFQGLFLMSELLTAGSPGFSGFNRMTGQMLNLNLILLPIMGMLIGSLSISGGKEDRQWQLIQTYPLPTGHLILGKFVGLSLAFTGILAVSYGLLGMIGFFVLPGSSIEKFLLFLLGSLVLVLIYLSIGIWLGNLARNRLQAIAGSVVIWFVSLFVLPFAAINTAMILPAGWVKSFLLTLIILNPVEFVRVSTILLLGNGAILGTPYYDLNQWFPSLYGYMTVFSYTLIDCLIILWLASRTGRRAS
ncbi:MAG: ABC transporter permease subunit [Bacillaceae bacterium]|nr:ABC transporter permease subunit [Bacillaceae bacterium]